jgi:hypothetical protein
MEVHEQDAGKLTDNKKDIRSNDQIADREDLTVLQRHLL